MAKMCFIICAPFERQFRVSRASLIYFLKIDSHKDAFATRAAYIAVNLRRSGGRENLKQFRQPCASANFSFRRVLEHDRRR